MTVFTARPFFLACTLAILLGACQSDRQVREEHADAALLPGDHEYYTPNAVGYYSYFGNAAGPDWRGCYSFSLGGWRIISLNSYLKPEQHNTQLAWLKEELAHNPARCTLAYWHHPLYSSGGHGSDKRMQDAWAILHAAGAELCWLHMTTITSALRHKMRKVRRTRSAACGSLWSAPGCKADADAFQALQ